MRLSRHPHVFKSDGHPRGDKDLLYCLLSDSVVILHGWPSRGAANMRPMFVGKYGVRVTIYIVACAQALHTAVS